MKRNQVLLVTGTFLLLLVSCEKNLLVPDSNNLLYYNSFEVPDDIVGWGGFGSIDLYNDAPEGGGGSCGIIKSHHSLIPHVSYDLGRVSEETTVQIDCYLKTSYVYNSGGIYLSVNDEEKVKVSIRYSVLGWVHVTSAPLVCPRKGELRIEGMTGDPILIDMLKIVVVE